MIISKTVTFAAAHRLMKYSGKCNNLHGHTWKVELVLQGDVNSRTGMVLDFEKIKEYFNAYFDHKVLLNKADQPLIKLLVSAGQEVTLIDGEPTCENLCVRIKQDIENLFGVKVLLVRVWETEHSYAELREVVIDAKH